MNGLAIRRMGRESRPVETREHPVEPEQPRGAFHETPFLHSEAHYREDHGNVNRALSTCHTERARTAVQVCGTEAGLFPSFKIQVY